MYHVYVLVSSEGYNYVGFTKDLRKRLSDHNNGRSFYTRRGTHWKVVYYESCASSVLARKREKYFKSHAGKEWLSRRNIL